MSPTEWPLIWPFAGMTAMIGMHEGHGGLTIDDDVQDLFAFDDLEKDDGSFEGGAQVGSGPLIGVVRRAEVVGGGGWSDEDASAGCNGQRAQGGRRCNFVRFERGGMCGGGEEGSAGEGERKILERVTHPDQYTARSAAQLPGTGNRNWLVMRDRSDVSSSKRNGSRICGTLGPRLGVSCVDY